MALTNLNNTNLTATNVTADKTALTQLKTALVSINTSLTANDRQKYGSIYEQSELFAKKVYNFNQNQSALSTTQIFWTEFNNDYTSHTTLECLINRLESLTTKLRNAKILHDYNNFQAALVDYAYNNFMAGTGAPG